MKHDSHDDMTVAVNGKRVTDDEKRAAQLTVVELCPDDAATILAMLGLDR